VCALAHYLEAAGIPTVVVALIREHAAAIAPPRTLWVPFELGRPLGAPEDAAFQRRVLEAALGLLAADSGPVLVDHLEDAPADAGPAEDEGWACPVSFAAPATDAPETHTSRLRREIDQLRPWSEAWKRRRGFSNVGVAGAPMEALADFVGSFADGEEVTAPTAGADVADGLKLAVGDLMTYYQEAANAQPGAAGGSAAISDWFWGETAAGKALIAARERGQASGDARLARVAGALLLPHIARRFAE